MIGCLVPNGELATRPRAAKNDDNLLTQIAGQKKRLEGEGKEGKGSDAEGGCACSVYVREFLGSSNVRSKVR